MPEARGNNLFLFPFTLTECAKVLEDNYITAKCIYKSIYMYISAHPVQIVSSPSEMQSASCMPADVHSRSFIANTLPACREAE